MSNFILYKNHNQQIIFESSYGSTLYFLTIFRLRFYHLVTNGRKRFQIKYIFQLSHKFATFVKRETNRAKCVTSAQENGLVVIRVPSLKTKLRLEILT